MIHKLITLLSGARFFFWVAGVYKHLAPLGRNENQGSVALQVEPALPQSAFIRVNLRPTFLTS
jgi:hypothetical protein